jgi:hypothetical protein
MAFLDINFDEIPQSSGDGEFKPLPVGWYSAKINKAELKATKDGTGQYIAIRYDITGPTHQGRVVFGNVNIKNKSFDAENIGRKQLNDIRLALGIGQLSDTDQLVGGSLQIKLEIKEATDQYAARNEVKAFKSSGDAMPIAASVPTFSKPAEAKATGSAPPWAKK